MENQSLWSFEGLDHLLSRGGADMRPTLLRVLTDLYVEKLKHTPDEEQHYTELALRLLEAADVPTRMAVAARLARHLSPPMRVLQRLAGDLPEVATPVRSHPILQAAIRAEPAAPQPAASQAAASALRDARPLASPEAISPAVAGELNELFFAADATERRLILLNLDIVAPLAAGRLGVAHDPSIAQRLEAAALGRNREDFAQQLARSLQISREQARRIGRDHLGEPVVVAGKALGVPRDALYRILMFVNPIVGRSVERVHALAALHDEMTSRAADGMVTIWRALQDTDRIGAKHQPLTWDDNRGARVRPAAASRQPVPATRERRNAS